MKVCVASLNGSDEGSRFDTLSQIRLAFDVGCVYFCQLCSDGGAMPIRCPIVIVLESKQKTFSALLKSR